MNKITNFWNEVVIELKKVTWPRKDDLIGSAIVVLIFVLCAAVILGAMDSLFAIAMNKVLGA